MSEMYNIEDATGRIHRVLVTKSVQHDPYERILTVTPSGAARMDALPRPLTVAHPTPHSPRAVFVVDDE